MRSRAEALLLGVVFVAGLAAAQQPRLTNAKLETRSAAAGLEKQYQALLNSTASPAWMAYAVPVIDGRSSMCCYNDNCPGCTLEARRDFVQGSDQQPVKLEGRTHFFVFYRLEQHNLAKIRTFSEDCPLDAGGLAVYWLTDVRPAESVSLLASLAKKDADAARHTLGNAALAAIAMHLDPAADTALGQLAASDQPQWLRSQTAFWLGAQRGRKGYEFLQRMLADDPSEQVRDRVVFALSVSKEPQAVDAIIAAAKSDQSPKVRGQALFWLAQKAGEKAAGAISEAIEKDPETEVKKRAIFALSQLPKDEGVPLLIQVARTNKNPVARKQAIFWLGQSKDPRALAFFQEVLTQ
jgi:HEAT repeat protein